MDPNKKVLGQSGITFATGFDVGQHSEKEIKSYGFPKALEEKLLPFAGIKKERAKELLPLARDTILTKEEANRVDLVIKGGHLKAAIKSWNANRLENTPLFKDLSSAQQTILLSRTFHQGPDMPNTPIAKNFYESAINNNWIKSEKYLKNYKVTDAYYINRVNKEANFLQQERLSK